MQLVAVYTIESGQNAGASDGPISILWLKAFGCGAVTVPGPASRDPFHPIANPRKFDGLLPEVWSEGDNSVYQVPLRSASLAHVIPVSAVVARRPIDGLDVGQLRRFVTALEDPSLPLASLAWRDPSRGRIVAGVAPSQTISVQINYDPGWRASRAGQALRIRPDGLGMTIVEPECSGECVVDLEFRGGAERSACLGIALFTAAGVLIMLVWPRGRRVTGLR